MMSYEKTNNARVVGEIVLCISKMSRIFLFTQNKYFSIVFPFRINLEDKKLKFFYGKTEIDSSLISSIIETIDSKEFLSEESLAFVDVFYRYECEYKKNNGFSFWSILRDLMLMEDGYIRYDVDQSNFDKFKDKNRIDLHPLHHYDLFYSNIGTFKLGLKSKIKYCDFVDLVNKETDCYYLIKN